MTGTTAAQCIPFLILPLLSRLYTPENFGTYALYTAVVTFLAVVATWRYELAVVLPKDEREAANVAILTLGIATLQVLFIACLILIFAHPIERLLGGATNIRWLALVPISVLVVSFYQTALFWMSRKKRFARLAVASVANQVVMGIVRIVIGLISGPLVAVGLILGYVAGQIGALTVLGRTAFAEFRESSESATVAGMREAAIAHRSFPIFNTPYSLLGTFARDLIIYTLTAFSQVAAAGSFSFARALVSAPKMLLSASLGQVFFQKASECYGTPELEQLTVSVLRRLVLLGTPVFVFYMCWAPEVCVVLFGEKWRTAGVYSAWYAPAALLFLLSGWAERLYQVTNTQHVSLVIELVADVFMFAMLWLLLSAGVDPHWCVAAYSIACIFYYGTFLWMTFRVAKFAMSQLIEISLNAVLLAGVTAVYALAVRFIIPNLVVGFLVGGIGVGGVYAFKLTQFSMGRIKRPLAEHVP